MNAYDDLMGLLNSTSILSDGFKNAVNIRVLAATEQARERGREEGARELEAEVQELQDALEQAIDTGETLLRRLTCEQARNQILRARIDRMHREHCEEVGRDQYTQRYSQPRTDWIA